MEYNKGMPQVQSTEKAISEFGVSKHDGKHKNICKVCNVLLHSSRTKAYTAGED
jgi:hypothetical protein